MKYTFKNQFAKVPNKVVNPLLGVTYTDVYVGGSFLPDDNVSCLEMTPYDIIYRNTDIINKGLDYLGAFMGETTKKTQDGYIGKWSKDIDDNAKIYYLINNDKITKLIITPYEELYISNPLGCQYIIEQDNDMYDAFPEEDDVLFDSYDEAQQYLYRLQHPPKNYNMLFK